MRRLILLFAIVFMIGLMIPTIHSAELTDFTIDVKITSPKTAHVTENWLVSHNELDIIDLEQFKTKIIEANLDLDKLEKINSKIKPHIYLNKYYDISVGFDELANSVRLEYNITDLALERFFENDSEILWILNDNLLKFFLVNDQYYIPKGSALNITVYEPLVLQTPVPEGKIQDRTLIWSGVASNELRLTATEKKPPKPSFFLTNIIENSGFYYFVIILILVIVIVLAFREPLGRSIKKFVIKYSEIKSEKKKKDLFDTDFLDE